MTIECDVWGWCLPYVFWHCWRSYFWNWIKQILQYDMWDGNELQLQQKFSLLVWMSCLEDVFKMWTSKSIKAAASQCLFQWCFRYLSSREKQMIKEDSLLKISASICIIFCAASSVSQHLERHLTSTFSTRCLWVGVFS